MRRSKGKLLARELLSFKRPLLSVDMSACLCVYLFVRNSDAEYLKNRRVSGSYPLEGLQESAYCASISDAIDDVT